MSETAKLIVTVRIEDAKHVDDAVKAATNAASMAGAYTIVGCEAAGNDMDGWYVDLTATGGVRA